MPNDVPDRRKALFPPPAQPYEQDEEFAPNPVRITQPSVDSALLGIEPGIRVRHPGTETSVPYEEGQELRPLSALIPEPGAYVIRHEHHHVVETRDSAKEAGPMIRIPIDTNPTQILGRDSDRYRATILNLSGSASTITLGRKSDLVAAADDGYDLAAGASLDIRHISEVWGIVPAGGSAKVCVIVTRYTPNRGANQTPLGQ